MRIWFQCGRSTGALPNKAPPSRLVEVELRRSICGRVGESLICQGVQDILRLLESMSPPFFGRELSLQPGRDAILFILGKR
jgi:hypothetical protein